ncbi:hypothetical protein [Ectopseudomonas alcaliphila]|uniref:Uncharacterized protein n=1 Tax=Ectopseudomonas alcaliphila TaxID=101564 RepID=A0A1G7JFD0_9GAMM|nr:hypothetical protein [Pseudomonas alcaliphila]MDX5990464.1 hypothetical protein [Pseudomonas alcaliphila]MDX5995434.1 hypothetical protein [Pseudomonas alcaliphila]MDX5995479.1 hypothetical protein [Pseudomonas alcaliphila]SDF23628.1 hypothetical protein SAMN05216575_106214 [Pseudomonas alcaliphila]
MNDAAITKAMLLAELLARAQGARNNALGESERKSLDASCEKLAKELEATTGGAE